MTLNIVIVVFWHLGSVHTVPDGFCADKKTTLDCTSFYTQERWFWRDSVGTLRSNDADGNENVKKTIGLISKTTTLHVRHAFLYIYLPFFARLRREHA